MSILTRGTWRFGSQGQGDEMRERVRSVWRAWERVAMQWGVDPFDVAVAVGAIVLGTLSLFSLGWF